MELNQQTIDAITEAARAISRAVSMIMEALQEALQRLFGAIHEVWQQIEAQPLPIEPARISVPTPSSSAYYDRPYYRYKHRYRQERVWRSQG